MHREFSSQWGDMEEPDDFEYVDGEHTAWDYTREWFHHMTLGSFCVNDYHLNPEAHNRVHHHDPIAGVWNALTRMDMRNPENWDDQADLWHH